MAILARPRGSQLPPDMAPGDGMEIISGDIVDAIVTVIASLRRKYGRPISCWRRGDVGLVADETADAAATVLG